MAKENSPREKRDDLKLIRRPEKRGELIDQLKCFGDESLEFQPICNDFPEDLSTIQP
jgi:hypothetical protein